MMRSAKGLSLTKRVMSAYTGRFKIYNEKVIASRNCFVDVDTKTVEIVCFEDHNVHFGSILSISRLGVKCL